MVLSILVAISVISLITLGGGVYVVVKSRNMVRENLALVEDYFQTQGEDGLSPFHKTLCAVGADISTQVSREVMGMLQGSLGGTMKGAVNELEGQAMAESPLSAVMASMPKAIKKNPFAYMAMQALLSRNLPTGVGGGAYSGNGYVDLLERKHRQEV